MVDLPSGVERLRIALERRVAIEQAKGVVARRESINPGEALMRLLGQAQATHRVLADVAQAILAEAQPGT